MVGARFLRYRPDDPMLRVIACPVLPNQLRHLSAPWPVPWRIVLLVRSRGDGISARHQINTQIAIKRSSAGPADNGIGNLVHILRIHMNFAIQVRSDSQSCSKGIAYLKPQGTPAYAMRFEGPTCASSKPVQGIAPRRQRRAERPQFCRPLRSGCFRKSKIRTGWLRRWTGWVLPIPGIRSHQMLCRMMIARGFCAR